MLDPLEFEKRPLAAALKKVRRRTWLALSAEALSLCFWPAFMVLLFFSGLWMLEIPALTGVVGSVTCLILFLCSFVFFTIRGIKGFSWPDEEALDRRIERFNHLHHRPLSYLGDRLSNPQKTDTRALWHQGRENAFSSVKELKAPPANPVMARQDPLALRVLVLLLFIIGLTVAGPQAPERLKKGLLPLPAPTLHAAAENIVLRITPPAYTGLPEITLTGTQKFTAPVDIAAGSTLKAHVLARWGRPYLKINDRKISLSAIDPKKKESWSVESPIPPTDKIVLAHHVIGRMTVPVHYIADTPPQISFNGESETLPKGQIQIPVTLSDDYGIEKVTLRMTLDPPRNSLLQNGPVEDSRVLLTGPGAQDTKLIYDYSWHPWAGQPVIITLEAADKTSQTAITAPLHTTLPERIFFHPVAKNLAAFRRQIINKPESSAAPLSEAIEFYVFRPQLYRGDIAAFLSLRSMSSRLWLDQSAASALSVVPQLWDTALRIEDGNLTFAARELEAAQEALSKLLQDPAATDEQIAAAMEDLREATAAYLQEMLRDLQRKLSENSGMMMEIPPGPALQMNFDALAQFMDQMQAQALSGDRDSAQDMLAQLRQMMSKLGAVKPMEMPPEMKAMMEAMGKLDELIREQEELLGNCQQQGDKSADPQPGDAGDLKKRQEDIRFKLGDLMAQTGEKLGSIPENLQQAEQEMRQSSDALGENDTAGSMIHQEASLEHMRQAQNEMKQKMAAMMQGMAMLSFGAGALDPLGRPLDDGNGMQMFPDSTVKIPDKAERKKVQEILQILRQRSGELSRPDYELEYYRRLMKQF